MLETCCGISGKKHCYFRQTTNFMMVSVTILVVPHIVLFLALYHYLFFCGFPVISAYFHLSISCILPKLSQCTTDDDVAQCFVNYAPDFEMYLQYIAGQSQAQACISDKNTQHFFKVSV